MGKKKKKGLSNRLAKMSDDERARYLQHRAAMEEEARRRKEQLISTFMKNKMKKEDGFTRLNIAKINEYWHQILRKICFKKMRQEILDLTDWIKRVVDIKNKIIAKLMIEIDESELQYELNFKSHLAFIDQFFDIHKHSQEHYRLDYEIKSSELFINSMRELNDKKEKSENEFQFLKTIIYGMEVEHDKLLKVYKTHTGEFLDDFDTSFKYEHEIMVDGYIKKMDNIWQNIYRTLNEYLSNTAVKRHHYIELKHLDDRNRKEREDNERKIARYTDTLNSLKSSYDLLQEDNEDELQHMIKQKEELTKEYSRLKRQLKNDLENDNRKFTKLTIISNQNIDKLKQIKDKGQNILQIVGFCRKYETEDEKSQSWAAQRKKWHQMYDIFERIADEQVEVEHAILTDTFKEQIKSEDKTLPETRVFVTKSAETKKSEVFRDRKHGVSKSAPKILKTDETKQIIKTDQQSDLIKFLEQSEKTKSIHFEDDLLRYRQSFSLEKHERTTDVSIESKYEILGFKERSVGSIEVSIDSQERIDSKRLEDHQESTDFKMGHSDSDDHIHSKEYTEYANYLEFKEGFMDSKQASIDSKEDSKKSSVSFQETHIDRKESPIASKQTSIDSKEELIDSKKPLSSEIESTSLKESIIESKELDSEKSTIASKEEYVIYEKSLTIPQKSTSGSKEESIECTEITEKFTKQSTFEEYVKAEESEDLTKDILPPKQDSISSKQSLRSEDSIPFTDYMKVVEEYLISGDESILLSEESSRSSEGSISKEIIPTKPGILEELSDSDEKRVKLKLVSSRESSVHSRESIHSLEVPTYSKASPIIKGSVKSREGSTKQQLVRSKGETVRFLDEYEAPKDDSIVTEMIEQLKVTSKRPRKKLRDLREQSKLKITGEELKVEPKEIKKETKSGSGKKKSMKASSIGSNKESEDVKGIKGDAMEIKGVSKDISRETRRDSGVQKVGKNETGDIKDSIEIREIPKGKDIVELEIKREGFIIKENEMKKTSSSTDVIEIKAEEEVKDDTEGNEVVLKKGSGVKFKEAKSSDSDKLKKGKELVESTEGTLKHKIHQDEIIKKKDDDSEKDDDESQIPTTVQETEENILERYKYLNNLSDLCWTHNRVELEIMDLKEEKKKLIEENKLFKEIIRGILEDAVLEPTPQKTPRVPKPAFLKSLKMVPQVPNTVFLEF